MIPLTEAQEKKLAEWIEANDPNAYAGASGGRYSYILTPTSIGLCVSVRDNLKKIEINLTDYSDW